MQAKFDDVLERAATTIYDVSQDELCMLLSQYAQIRLAGRRIHMTVQLIAAKRQREHRVWQARLPRPAYTIVWPHISPICDASIDSMDGIMRTDKMWQMFEKI